MHDAPAPLPAREAPHLAEELLAHDLERLEARGWQAHGGHAGSAVNTARSGGARMVRVHVVTPPGVLTRDGPKQLVDDAKEIVARLAGDPRRPRGPGCWGIAGTAFGKAELAALAARK